MTSLGPAVPPPVRGAHSPLRHWAARVAAALIAVGVLGGGIAFGWLLRGWVKSGGVGVTTTVVTRPVQVEARAVPGALPNVLGLQEDAARQAYADAGVDPSRIDVREVPYVAAPGSVVKQQPLAAAEVPSTKRVALLVAKPAQMPDLRGADADTARQRLAAIGVGIDTFVRFVPGVHPGTVAKTRPASGEAVGPRAVLVVAEEPSSVDLSGLEPLTSDCETTDVSVRGSSVNGAVLCDVAASPSVVEYPSNARVTAFKATLLVPDGAPAHSRLTLTVRSGGRLLGTFTSAGKQTPVSVTVPGGRKLTLQFSGTAAGGQSTQAALVDGRIIGARSGIDALVKSHHP